MARKKNKHKGGKSMTRTAFKLIRLAALVAPGAERAMSASGVGKVTEPIRLYTGYDIQSGQFNGAWLAQGWGPYIMACLATYGIPKLTSIIRRL